MPDVSLTIRQVVTDNGYHSNDVLKDFGELDLRTFVSDPGRSRRKWDGENGAEAQAAVYANRRRIRGDRGRRFLARRGEFIERTFAHCYEMDAMRRLHVRGDANITKRLLLQAAAFNLSLVMRKLFKAGTPRGFADKVAALCCAIWSSAMAIKRCWDDLLAPLTQV